MRDKLPFPEQFQEIKQNGHKGVENGFRASLRLNPGHFKKLHKTIQRNKHTICFVYYSVFAKVLSIEFNAMQEPMLSYIVDAIDEWVARAVAHG